jgi:membrane associated rhomboid family serine protease
MMPFGPARTTRAVKILLIANLVMFLFQIIPWIGGWVSTFGALIPYETFARGQLWRLFSYMFLHDTGSPFHILFNMLVLWMFGVEIEHLWGSARFTGFYLICGAGSALFSIINVFNDMRFVHVIGASGAVLGVLTVYAYYFPARQVLLFFILPINIRIVVIGYALFSLFGSIQNNRSVISHLTHLGGIVVAFLYLKTYPAIATWYEELRSTRSQHSARERAEQTAQRKRYFESTVDPILEKIAKQGMESLTKQERRILEEASRTDRDRLKKNKILPFDLFK